MVENPNPSSLADLLHTYNTILEALGDEDKEVLGVSVADVNKRVLTHVSTNVHAITSEIKSTVTHGIQISKDVGAEATTFPDVMSRELTTLPESLGMEKVAAIPSLVNMLMANFQNALEDPQSLYPRLVCGDIPVDPAKIINYAKQHRVLEYLYDADATVTEHDRSMPSAPKSASDVITNINSSLELLSDTLLESVEKVSSIRTNFDELKDAADSLKSVREPVDEILNQQEHVHGIINRISSIFSDNDDEGLIADRSVARDGNAVELITEGSSLVDEMNVSQGVFEEAMAKIQSIGGIFAEMATNLRSLFTRMIELFSNLVEVLKRFVANLPRYMKELRQFFVPTGLRSLLMRPSQDMLLLLQNMDDLKTKLPDPDSIETSTREVLTECTSAKKVEDAKGRLDELLDVPKNLILVIEKHDMNQIMSDAARETLSLIMDEIQDSVFGDAVDHVAGALGMGGLTGKLEGYLPFGGKSTSNTDGKDEEKEKGGENGKGGLFKRFF